MTAIQAMKNEVLNIHRRERECLSDEGNVFPWMVEKYRKLVSQENEFLKSIEWMEKLNQGDNL